MHRLNYCLLLLLIQSGVSNGNVRLVCPRPTTSSSDQESVSYLAPSSCEEEPDGGNDFVTDLDPGLFTVRFEETKFQSGSPFRIILLDNKLEETTFFNNDTNSTDSYFDGPRESCLLLDHIPHNDHAVVIKECSQQGNHYPLGICNGSTYYITVRIPDVTCEDCTLMLQQVIVDQEHEMCELKHWNDTDTSGDCRVYRSCAKVRIRASPEGDKKDLSQCADYLNNLPGDWPYRPEDIFKTDHGVTMTLDLLHKTLHISMPSGLKLGPIERVEVRENLTVVWNVTVREMDKAFDTVEVEWKNLSEDEIEMLQDEKLVLNIVGSKKSLAADIQYLEQHFSEGRLGYLHDVYSDSGWLVADKFLGPHAQDPVAALPAGPCAPQAYYYVAFLQSVHVTAHGILGMVVLENRAYITVVLHVEHEQVETITIRGPALVDIPMLEIWVPPTFTGVVQAAFDISKQLPFLDTVQFLKSVEVTTDKEDAVLVGDLEEGFFTILRNEAGHIHGMGAFQFLQGQWLRVEVVLNNLAPEIESAYLYGPGSELVDLSRVTVHCDQAFCCLEDLIRELRSELLLHLMTGQASLHVTTKVDNVTGKVVGSALHHCQMMGGSCEAGAYDFSMSGVAVRELTAHKDFLQTPQWTEAEAYVLDRANVLHFSVQLGNLNLTGQKFTVGLETRGQRLAETPLELVSGYNNLYKACGDIPLEDKPAFIKSLSGHSSKTIHLVIKNGTTKFLDQNVPIVNRGECIHSTVYVIGKDAGYWSPSSTALSDVYAVVSDHLKFIFDENTTLFLMASKKDLIECNFSTARQMVALDTVGEKGFYFFTLTKSETLYFADRDSCNSTVPLQLTVHAVDGAELVQDDSKDEWCRESVYSVWREKQLKNWVEPEVSGPILIGLVVGLSSAGAFLLWQGIRLRRIPDGFRGTGDNVFVRF